VTEGSSTHHSRSESDTASIATQLGRRLAGGSVILLFGDLGAGKTAFVRGLVEGVDGDSSEVSSPTFTLVQPYAGRLTVQHVDLYRLGPEDVGDLGLEELSTPSSIVAVEWADRLARRPGDAICVRIDDLGGDDREIKISGAPEET
jgi:tRNA threonylcarbamoyladenosine biosynthesis protein TsaE